jgi:hypothetical protein
MKTETIPMASELAELHEHMFKPILSARKYLNASKLVDAMLEVGLAVSTKAPASQVLVKLTDLSVEFNKVSEANKDWVAFKMNESKVYEAFTKAVAAARPVIKTSKPGKPKGVPTAATELQAKCKRKVK